MHFNSVCRLVDVGLLIPSFAKRNCKTGPLVLLGLSGSEESTKRRIICVQPDASDKNMMLISEAARSHQRTLHISVRFHTDKHIESINVDECMFYGEVLYVRDLQIESSNTIHVFPQDLRV